MCKTLKNLKDSSQNIVDMLNAITPDTYATIKQLPSPYDGTFYFVIELSMSETNVNKFVNQQIVDELISYMKHVTINFSKGTDYYDNLLSEDTAIYHFDYNCKLVKPLIEDVD